MLSLRRGPWLLSFRCYLFNRSSLDTELTDRLLHESLDAERYGLHRVSEDPSQLHNLLHEDWPLTQSLREALVARRLGPGAVPPRRVSAEQLRALRLSPSQGYR